MSVTTRIDLTGLKEFRRLVRTGASRKSGPLHDFFIQAAARYLGFTRRRFITYSRGGGSWPPLKKSTIRKRRKGRGSGSPAILRDTSTLLTSLGQGAPGNVISRTTNGIAVGIGGSARHGKRGRTIGQIAEFHQIGAGNLPVREVIPGPDDIEKQVQAGWVRDANAAIGKILKQAEQLQGAA